MKKILLVLVAVLLLTGCKDKENTNTKDNTNPSNENNTVEKETVRFYQFNNVTTLSDDPTKEVTDVQQIYLLDDGTYWFISGVDCREAAYGSYTEDDTTVVLKELKTYGCHDCYYEGLDFTMTFTKQEGNLELSGIIFEKQTEKVDMTKVVRTTDKNCAAE